jgi:hypothetical protein
LLAAIIRSRSSRAGAELCHPVSLALLTVLTVVFEGNFAQTGLAISQFAGRILQNAARAGPVSGLNLFAFQGVAAAPP